MIRRTVTTYKVRRRHILTMSAAIVFAASAVSAVAAPVPYVPSQGTPMRVTTQTSPARTQVLNLAKGRSAVIDLPADASDVFVSNPAVADAVLRTPRRIFVLGVAAGQSDAIFFDGMGRQILNLSIRVEAPTDNVADTVHRLFPDSHVEVQSLNGHIVLSGMAKNAGDADQINRLAQTYVDKPENVLNLITIAGKDQVTLKVRIVEVNRNSVKQLGFDTSAVIGQLGGVQYALSHSPTYGVNNKLLGGITGGYKVDTTSMPVVGYPVGNVFGGLSQGGGSLMQSLAAVGLDTSNFLSTVSNYLTGGGSLTSAQSGYMKSYLNGLLSTVSTDVTSADGSLKHTVWAAGAGITSDNLPTLMQSYLQGNTGNMSGDQVAWLNAFANKLPAYNNAAIYSISSASDSTLTDRKGNPADYLASGRAGSAGLNKGSAMIQAFEQVGLARTLAEPNLTAISGESARFLAGGEFPVPVGQDNQGRVTVEFKPFGVGLGFTPVVLSSGRISLKVSTEVSELTNVGALSLSSSLTIPGLTVRRAETSVEMQSGSSLMIAGLLQSKYRQAVDSLPGLTTLPVLGTLFRSRDFLNDETEMVVIITPYIVEPTDPNTMQTPADNLEPANDMASTFMGNLNKVIHKPVDSHEPPPPATPYQAPIGYVIE